VNTVPTTHPAPERLFAFAHGRLDAAEHEAVERHVLECPDCTRALAAAGDDSLVHLARAAASASTPGLSGTMAFPSTVGAPSLPDLPPELRDHPRYRVLGVLGAGGMGVVYKAEHRLMHRPVALKVINRRYTLDTEAIDRFRREVRAAAQLSHPNIVTAHDAEQAGDLHFLVMEFVEGVDLAKLVSRKGPMAVATACHLIRQAALGLQHAHEKGLVHRDIKPNNLVVTRKGQLKILDFGLARLTDPDGPAHSTAGLTAPSLVMGTPDFLSPEQARDARKADIRSDLYSLGCTLFYLLTGRVPFPAGSVIETMFRHCEDRPESVCALRPEVPQELSDIVARLMAKRPEDRYQTPAELAAALAPFARNAAGRAASVVASAPTPAPAPSAVADTEPEPFAPGDELPPARSITPRPHGKPKRRKASRLPLFVGATAILLSLPLLAYALWKSFGPGWPPAKAPAAGPALERRDAPRLPRGDDPPPGARRGPPLAPPADRDDAPPPPPGREHRVLFVLPARGLWYADYGDVRRHLDRAGVAVEIASSEAGSCLSDFGSPGDPVPIDLVLDRPIDNPTRYAAVIFAGKVVDDFLPSGRSGRVVGKLIADLQAARRPVTAICIGQKVLAAHGVLRGRVVARNPFLGGDPDYQSADVQPRPVAVDRGVITGGTAEHADPFARVLLQSIGALPPPDGPPPPPGARPGFPPPPPRPFPPPGDPRRPPKRP
jgi:serine/threonine protein kinase/putative intracellular protease/amidase